MTHQTATAGLLDANLFDISGPILIHYSRSSIAGVPLLSYRDAALDLAFQGNEIGSVSTPVGELITVTLENIPDALTTTFTMIIPTIRVSGGGETDFDTLGIETTDRTGAFVPAPGPAGVLQTHRVHQLHGIARQVDF
jgi:hypothetical protein